MERTPENNSFNNSTTQNPAQNELDLEFNHMEPITPKKAVKSEPSFFNKTFDKAKSVFAKKEAGEPTQFNVRKEPTFGQPAVSPQLPDEDEFYRQVEALRKGTAAKQNQAASDSNYTPTMTFGQAVAQSKGIAPRTTTVNTAPSQTAQVSQPAAISPATSKTDNHHVSETATAQTQPMPASADITSQQPQVQNNSVFSDKVQSQNIRTTAEFTQATQAKPQTSVNRVYSDVTPELPKVEVTTEFAELSSTQLKVKTTEEVSETISAQVVSQQPQVQITTESNVPSAPIQPTVQQTTTGFSDAMPAQSESKVSSDFSTIKPQTQTTTGFADAMAAQNKVETVSGFSDVITSQTQSQTTQGFTDAIKTPQAAQTISGFSNAIAEHKAEADKPIVVEMPQTETVKPQLQNIESLTDSIAAQVKTQLADELLHHTEATVTSKTVNNNGFTETLEKQTTADNVFSPPQKTETQKTSSDNPLTISIEKEINTTEKQKSLQNDGFFDRTSLSNSEPEVTIKPSIEKDLSTDDDFVNEFRTLQTKSTDEPASPDDDFLNEFEAIKAKAQTQNEEPVRDKKMKNPENWSVMQKLPPKHRRLFIAILGLLLLLIAFFWLKPGAPTVEDFQAQTNNNNLPIEFQPLDQSQNIEDHNAPATQETSQPNNAQPQPENQTEQTASIENTSAETVDSVAQTGSQIEISALLMQESSALAQTVLQLPAVVEASANTTDATENNAQTAENTQPKSASERIKAMEQRASGQQQPQKQQKLSRAEREKQRREAKKTAQNNNQAEEDQLAEPISAGRAKTLTIPSGVSLMQVFRDNNLHIADVNAMTKAAGGNVLSNFKPGDQVKVVVNAQGRVNILRLSNGATFVRQTNGTYKYHP